MNPKAIMLRAFNDNHFTMRLLTLIAIVFAKISFAQHPVAFATRSDLAGVKADLKKYPLLAKSYTDLKSSVDRYLGTDVDVPFPKDPAGGYTHDRHKENYMLIFNSGLLYQLTNDVRYATLAKNILLKYAALNPKLGKHPEASSSSPGHIFWQALNDANWLVYSGLGYDLLYNTFTSDERKRIEEGAFKPEVEYFTRNLKDWFNLIHNHGVWACAGVGIVGIATNNEDYLQMALYGTDKKGTGGYIAQLNQLFSPDGYYTEGPYYVRYALLPFYMFASALDHARPSLKIFEERNQILRKALLGGLQQTNIDGSFLPFNDALKDKDYTTNELVTAVAIATEVYGIDEGLLTVAKKQDRVLVNRGGAAIARALAGRNNISQYYPYKTIEFSDGSDGKEGGISLLRSGNSSSLTTLGFKYASHGLSHGHFDRLGILLFDRGREILQDYGSVRFINIEQKWGGRYLPENKTFASQTVVHNTVVVDEESQFKGKEAEAEKYSGEKLFSSINNSNVQVVSAREKHAYEGVEQIRTLYMIQIPGQKQPMVVDLYRLKSNANHQYDLPFQYIGQVISTSFRYRSALTAMQTMGSKNGYQYLWKEAEAATKDSTTQFTFLNNGSYYTISTATPDSARVYFTRSGASDPDFNLRREPSFLIRRTGNELCFFNVIEIHGKFDPIAEFSTNSYSSVKEMRLLTNGDEFTAARMLYKGKQLLIIQSNNNFENNASHSFSTGGQLFKWQGPVGVWYDGKQL